MKRKVLVVSNGYGEDQIACNIVVALQKEFPGLKPLPVPLVGEGLEYKKRGWMPRIANLTMPSGGFVRRAGSLWSDLRSGLLSQMFRQRRLIKKMTKEAHFTICVGDVYCLWMGAGSKRAKTFFFPTAKSDRFMKHTFLERWVMRLKSRRVFPRDAETAQSLAKRRVPALYLGNLMMDGIPVPCGVSQFAQLKHVVGLLPGSREEAYENLAHLTKVVEAFGKRRKSVHFVLARADTVALKKISDILKPLGWEFDTDRFVHTRKIEILVSDDFWDVVQCADVILGLSGTANEQAVYIGKTVICFEGFGPQSTKQRFLEQQKLLGDAIVFSEDNSPKHLADLVKKYLDKPEAHSARPESPHASTRIAKVIKEEYA